MEQTKNSNGAGRAVWKTRLAVVERWHDAMNNISPIDGG